MSKWAVRHERRLRCIAVVDAETADAACDLVESGDVELDECDIVDEYIDIDDVEPEK